jgi:hypothetical protein
MALGFWTKDLILIITCMIGDFAILTAADTYFSGQIAPDMVFDFCFCFKKMAGRSARYKKERITAFEDRLQMFLDQGDICSRDELFSEAVFYKITAPQWFTKKYPSKVHDKEFLKAMKTRCKTKFTRAYNIVEAALGPKVKKECKEQIETKVRLL